MRPLVAVVAVLALAWLAAAEREVRSAQPRTAQEKEKAFGGRYAILIERNIFSRNRPQRYVPLGDPGRDRGEKRFTPPPEETSYILTGVVREDGKYAAFIENSRTGATVKAKVGDAVARGKITAIHIDGLTYASEGRTMALQIGKTLAGERPSSRLEREGPSSRGEKVQETKTADSGGEKAAESGGSSSADDIIARMKKRREMEMKK